MIFTTTGTSAWDFSRLIKIMDELALKLETPIFLQIGYAKYIPKNCEYVRYISKSELEALYEKASLIVSHAGVGSILTAVRLNKNIIVFPRRQAFHEHIDDHQLELVNMLEHPLVHPALNENDLENVILSLLNFQNCVQENRSGQQLGLARKLAEYLRSLEDAEKSYGKEL